MNSVSDFQAIETTTKLIQASHLVVVFTGAGISTPSGIPDFRGSADSLWALNNPMEVASLTTFYNQPERFFNWLHPLAEKIANAQPNQAHQAIAQLEQAGYIQAIITQNIDNLHQRAGSKHVLELHGSIRSATCQSCQIAYPVEIYQVDFLQNHSIPRCPECGTILKPDIILFEELLPFQTWAQAEKLSETCDIMLVAGASLEVVPAASLPSLALRNGAQLIIINQSSTHLDKLASVVIHDDVEKILPIIARSLL